MKIDPSFKRHIDHIIVNIERSNDSIFILDGDLNIVGYNDRYLNFAKTNGEPDIEKKFGIGSCLLNAIPDTLQGYYRNSYMKSLVQNLVFEFDYHCSSPKEYRLFHQTAYPIPGRAGLVVTNHCIVAKEMNFKSLAFNEHYISSDGVVFQCTNCRKLKNHTGENQWDWVPEALVNMHPDTSPTFCNFCLEHYYPLCLEHYYTH